MREGRKIRRRGKIKIYRERDTYEGMEKGKSKKNKQE